jgi:hypothetical protein
MDSGRWTDSRADAKIPVSFQRTRIRTKNASTYKVVAFVPDARSYVLYRGAWRLQLEKIGR